jgi:radical SAM superfamily enzyme YgiQ (UPF0313 family)
MRKLLLINPVNPHRIGLTVNVSSRFPPLGLGIVAALTPDTWEIEIIDENFEPFCYKEADLVGLTAFTSAVTRAYKIAGLYREKGIPTVLGGIHASTQPEEALQYVDCVVVGEAESVWRRVISDCEAGTMKRVYTGAQQDLKEMPQPRRDLFHPGYLFGSIQTARGCPMDCEFCSVTSFNGRRYRQRPVEDVLDELETIPQDKVFFVDDNIIGYSKEAAERAITLFKGIINRGIKKDWFCQASMNVGSNQDVLTYAAQSGCRIVFLGVEAENIDALHEVNKNVNVKLHDTYEETFYRINNNGIAVLGSFIYGMDSDTPEALDRRTDYILKSGVDVMQVTYLTPLPGTRLFERLRTEGRLLYTDFPADWDHYDMTEVTHQPRLMSPPELAETMSTSVNRLYSRRSLMRKFFKTVRATKSFTTAMWALTSNKNYRAVALGNQMTTTCKGSDPHE